MIGLPSYFPAWNHAGDGRGVFDPRSRNCRAKWGTHDPWGIALVAYGHWPQSSGEWVGFAKVLLPFAGSLLGSLILVGIFIHFVPNLPLINNIMIKRSKYSEEPVFPFGTTLQSLVGKDGVAQTDLRPSGTALILGEYLDVLTDGEFIPQGSSIQVVEVNPPRIIVRAVVESPPTLPL